MSHEEWALPIYLSLLALFLIMWLALPVMFITLLLIKIYLYDRDMIDPDEEDGLVICIQAEYNTTKE